MTTRLQRQNYSPHEYLGAWAISFFRSFLQWLSSVGRGFTSCSCGEWFKYSQSRHQISMIVIISASQLSEMSTFSCALYFEHMHNPLHLNSLVVLLLRLCNSSHVNLFQLWNLVQPNLYIHQSSILTDRVCCGWNHLFMCVHCAS